MTDTTIQLTAADRAKLKAVLRRTLREAGKKHDLYGDVSAMGKDALLAALAALAINVRAALAFNDVTTTTTPDTADVSPDVDPATIIEVAPEPNADTADTATVSVAGGDVVETRKVNMETPPPADPAVIQHEVATVLAPFATGDFDEVKRRLTNLAEHACVGSATRVVTIERTKTITVQVEAPATTQPPREGEAPHAVRVGTATLGDLFGITGRAAGVKLSTWKGPLSAKVDPAWRWQPEVMTTIGIALSKGRPVMLHGARGTGKSSMAEQIAAATGREFVRISCTDTTEAQELVGKHGPDGKGGIVWIDGQLTQAIRRPGCIILVDEPSVARAGAIMILQSVMDSARVLFISETGERVPVAPGTVVMLADNTNGTGDETGAYEGTGRLNAATLDRPAVNVRVGYMSADDEAAMVCQRIGCTRALADQLVEFAGRTRTDSNAGHIVEGLSPRRVMALAELLHFGCSWEAAWRDAVLNSATAADRQHLTQLGQSLVSAHYIEAAAL